MGGLGGGEFTRLAFVFVSADCILDHGCCVVVVERWLWLWLWLDTAGKMDAREVNFFLFLCAYSIRFMARSKKKLVLKYKRGGRRGGGTKKRHRGGFEIFGRKFFEGTPGAPGAQGTPETPGTTTSYLQRFQNYFFPTQAAPRQGNVDGPVDGTKAYVPSVEFMETRENPYKEDYKEEFDPSIRRFAEEPVVLHTNKQVRDAFGVGRDGNVSGGTRRRRRPRSRRRR